ncbi:hypothetical protein [Chamaesiphon sp. VAR_69_metabat_338]|uniref:hypothetical protein n=1 Tax=Chamaesiphon sp. VAR_69_metabat_338 TaxID=2964704 RepID=UPI00286E66A4|nr:hypothetical protein [Chamaesiphon sp. VAR_69_metabat_338]
MNFDRDDNTATTGIQPDALVPKQLCQQSIDLNSIYSMITPKPIWASFSVDRH